MELRQVLISKLTIGSFIVFSCCLIHFSVATNLIWPLPKVLPFGVQLQSMSFGRGVAHALPLATFSTTSNAASIPICICSGEALPLDHFQEIPICLSRNHHCQKPYSPTLHSFYLSFSHLIIAVYNSTKRQNLQLSTTFCNFGLHIFYWDHKNCLVSTTVWTVWMDPSKILHTFYEGD